MIGEKSDLLLHSKDFDLIDIQYSAFCLLCYRGAFIVARLASVAPERILAYAFLAVSYIAPNPDFDFQAGLKATKAAFGYELFGYQAYFAEDTTAAILEKNVSSLMYIFTPVIFVVLINGIR